MVKRFFRSGRTGFYLAVIKEGELTAGDEIERVPTDRSAVTIPEVVTLYTSRNGDGALLQRAIATPALPLPGASTSSKEHDERFFAALEYKLRDTRRPEDDRSSVRANRMSRH